MQATDIRPVQAILAQAKMLFIGPPGIEPGLYPPHGHVLPIYYGPSRLHRIPRYNLGMLKARNGTRYPASTKERARLLRAEGLTHREMAKKLGVSISTAHLWTKGIPITPSQKQAIEARKNQHRMSTAEKKIIKKRLASYQYQVKYSDMDLIKKIRDFYTQNGRIPLKREFNALRVYRIRFGSWNNAIKKAGFKTNPVLFSKKFIASDGHICDSFTERIIDDWLSANNIAHERNVRYGTTKFTADFKIYSDIFIEFFGLVGVQKVYDRNIEKKRLLAKKLGYELIEIYPNDMYPKNKLSALLRDVLCRAAGNREYAFGHA